MSKLSTGQDLPGCPVSLIMEAGEMLMENARIPCMRCVHYQVTFDPNAPRGCKLYHFKSATMPSVLVKQSTGHDCTSFEEKVKKSGDNNGGKKDFNDPKYWG